MLQRLQKIIAQAGVCSRRKAEQYILDGKVMVNGKAANELGVKADPERDRISVAGLLLKSQRNIYILLNKPKGYICTSEDTHSRKKVIDLIKGVKERLFTIGRLDKDTEGLLLLTNDGNFAHHLMHPSFEIKKVYQVILDKGCALADIKRLEKGIVIDGKKTKACQINLLAKSGKVLVLTIHEGRKRQIRQMFFCFGYEVVDLKRIKYGSLTLGNLKTGHFRFLTGQEIKTISRGSNGRRS